MLDRPARLFCLHLAFAFAAGAPACVRPDPQARQYELRGQILDIRPQAQEVLIKHGDIEGFMPAMTMPFKAKASSLLNDKKIGDLVTARLMVRPDSAWLDSLEKTGSAPIDDPAAIPAASFLTPLAEGDLVPESTLIDQHEQPITLTDWRKLAMVVTFVYTRCPLPQFCPLMDRRFLEIQNAVRADPILRGRVRLLSVSFDPEHDTPAVLRAHAMKVKADPSIWRFATASREEVDRFAAHFGANVVREKDGTITHNLRTAVVGPDGRVVRIHDGGAARPGASESRSAAGDWSSQHVLDDLRGALDRTPER